jgi:4-hydroxy-3-methylbut-2-enyl diphosphate reductase
MKKTGVVAQTTQSYDNFCQIVEACLSKCQELRVFNTICDATTVRQEEASAIAGQVDLVLVIGGYNSANTTRLARICKDIQPNTYHVETAAEVDEKWFANTGRVGITAGASTPQWIIDEVYEKVAQVGK